jgi:hypothetical protein
LPGGSFAALLLATAIGYKALTARGTPSPLMLAVFLVLELGYVVATMFAIVSISLETQEEQKALMDDIPKVQPHAPPLPHAPCPRGPRAIVFSFVAGCCLGRRRRAQGGRAVYLRSRDEFRIPAAERVPAERESEASVARTWL